MGTRNVRRWERPRFSSTDRMRLVSGTFMLVIIILLMRQLGDPSMWRWAGRDDAEPVRLAGQPSPDDAARAATAAAMEKGNAGAVAAPGSETKPPADAPAAEQSPADQPQAEDSSILGTDLDPDEQDAIREELQALNDRALAMEPVEMLPYRRILKWVEKQSAADMEKRALREVYFNDFIQTPNKYRGKLFVTEMDVHRILERDRTDGPGKTYELWGVTPSSATWLVVAITPELPADMPIGNDVFAKVRLVGYYFKIQGYVSAHGFAGGRTQPAPMFIGKVTWLRRPLDVGLTQQDWIWIAVAIGGLTLVGIISLATLMWSQRKRRAGLIESRARRVPAMSAEEWIDRAASGSLPGASDADGNNRANPSESA